MNRMKQENIEIQNKLLEKESEIIEFRNEIQKTDEEKRQFLKIIQKHDSERNELQEELNSQELKIHELVSKNFVLEETISDSKSDEMSIPFLKEKFLQEKKIFEKQNQWLNDELNKKSTELLQIRNELVRKT